MKTRDLNDPADSMRSEWLGGFRAMPQPNGDFPPFHWVHPTYCPVAGIIPGGWRDNGNGQFGAQDTLIWAGPVTDTVLVVSVVTGARLTPDVIPSTTPYGLAALVLLLAGASLWVFRKRLVRGAGGLA